MMPKVRYKEMVVEIQGTMFDVVFKKSPRGKTIVTKKPDMSEVEWSNAQTDHRKRMRHSNDYAKAAMADSDVRAVYEKRAAKEGRVAYNVALSDYWKGINLLLQPNELPTHKNKQEGEAGLSSPTQRLRKPSKAQQEEWDRIIEAASYAAAALADPELRTYYEAQAKKLKMQARHVVIADFLNGKNLLAK
jgi:hypothetical protein